MPKTRFQEGRFISPTGLLPEILLENNHFSIPRAMMWSKAAKASILALLCIRSKSHRRMGRSCRTCIAFWHKIVSPKRQAISARTSPSISVVKIRNTGREEPVCPDEPQKSLPDLGKSLKAPPLHLYPENPPKPR